MDWVRAARVETVAIPDLAEELRERIEEWRGKARANAAVDGPWDKYEEYLARAESLQSVLDLLENSPLGDR